MPINGYGRPDNVANSYRNDPIGLGMPYSPFSPSIVPIPDKFEYQQKSVNKSENNEPFTFGKAVSSFFKGITDPFVQMLRNPIQTLGIAAGIGFLIKKVPVVGKYAAMAGLAIGGLQVLTGLGTAVSGIADGKSAEAEKGFKSMGTGTVSSLLSIFGLKYAPKITTVENTTASKSLSIRGIIDKVKNFFNTTSRPNADQIKAELGNVPGYLKQGAPYQVPFVPYLYGNNGNGQENKVVEKNTKENYVDNGEPLVMQEAQRIYDKL
ncbi:MAG: DUF883 C-terminal domain-containing protein [Candidatus Gastranaerophilales bacterium]|nr:DUF883 C-terminal domain-containing protein [Candidatus Gastranaerophilales bacterium]